MNKVIQTTHIHTVVQNLKEKYFNVQKRMQNMFLRIIMTWSTAYFAPTICFHVTCTPPMFNSVTNNRELSTLSFSIFRASRSFQACFQLIWGQTAFIGIKIGLNCMFQVTQIVV